ncbi:MAG: hypothetical protein OXU76_05350, partial [Alphaproteobacteria bacterium]|nr:hypothetical protein [Alphaproteobacteria bacterium]
MFALFPATQARAVDGVVVSNSVRVVELTRHMRRVAPDMLEFAIQNTSKTAVSFELILSQPDPFHHIFLSPLFFNQPYSPPILRLIASDDSETTSAPNQPNRINIHLTPGSVQRFILQGQIMPQTGFWLWNPTYKAQIEARTKQFQRVIYATLAIFGFLSVLIAVKRQRKQLFLIPIITFGFIFLFFLRWSVVEDQAWQGEGIVNLGIIIILLVLLILLAHRAARFVPWVERRYWRTVMVCVDMVLVIVTIGWLANYFAPFFASIATRESLELILAFVPALLCLASIISLRLPSARLLSTQTDVTQNESAPESVI